jgi:hypothetical protein
MADPRVRAVEAYVQSLRTGAPSASARAAEYLAPDVVLRGGPTEAVGREAVLRRITGQWPQTPTYQYASWSEPRPDDDRLLVHAEFPPLGAAPASIDLAFSFDADGRIVRVEQTTVMQGTPPPPVADTIPDFVRGIVDNALSLNLPMSVAYVDPDGQPALSLRGSVQVYGDHQLSIWVRQADGGLVRALGHNPKLALLYRDSRTRTTLIFQGRGHVETDEAIRTHVFERSPEVEQNHDPARSGAAVLIDVTRIQGTSPRGPVRYERPST